MGVETCIVLEESGYKNKLKIWISDKVTLEQLDATTYLYEVDEYEYSFSKKYIIDKEITHVIAQLWGGNPGDEFIIHTSNHEWYSLSDGKSYMTEKYLEVIEARYLEKNDTDTDTDIDELPLIDLSSQDKYFGYCSVDDDFEHILEEMINICKCTKKYLKKSEYNWEKTIQDYKDTANKDIEDASIEELKQILKYILINDDSFLQQRAGSGKSFKELLSDATKLTP